ncbi:lysine N(6)-hydroxylase/L-ornithine N(5)-oxygenase family protein [Nocardioides sp.]|uniref:lysine N(6)-hydroxylase/L-ornithine N(5)-oxygenase family protein n=1 Tax=Nocardioides sp. TaxID=35761 RepID=UPI0035151B01
MSDAPITPTGPLPSGSCANSTVLGRDEERVHDLIGIGLGPFNLGLAALADPLAAREGLDVLFLERRERFAWHPGLLLENATLQVPFLADLVTMVDPTSRWSFLNFLRRTGRLYAFYIKEDFHPLRSEYDAYCRWVAEGLATVRFGQDVTAVERVGETFVVHTSAGARLRARHLAIGIGTAPVLPDVLRTAAEDGARVLHAADYLRHRESLLGLRHVCVVGSGQSAAEVYLDLLTSAAGGAQELTWLTRSPRFAAMDDSKLTLEMTSPEYGAYHRALPMAARDRLAREQRHLYRGISRDLIAAISDEHYRQRVGGAGPRTTLLTSTVVDDARPLAQNGPVRLGLTHTETAASMALTTDAVVAGTGYRPRPPDFLAPVEHLVRRDGRGRYDVAGDYSVDDAHRIFVQNAEEHTHSLLAPDLGMGPHRNAVILAAVLGREVYPVDRRVMVQTFGAAEHLRVPTGGSPPGTPVDPAARERALAPEVAR